MWSQLPKEIQIEVVQFLPTTCVNGKRPPEYMNFAKLDKALDKLHTFLGITNYAVSRKSVVYKKIKASRLAAADLARVRMCFTNRTGGTNNGPLDQFEYVLTQTGAVSAMATVISRGLLKKPLPYWMFDL